MMARVKAHGFFRFVNVLSSRKLQIATRENI